MTRTTSQTDPFAMQEAEINGYRLRGCRIGDGGQHTRIMDADGKWYAIFALPKNGKLIKGLWRLDGGYELHREATEEEWAADRIMAARVGSGSYEGEWAEEADTTAASEQALEVAAEDGRIAGAMPADQ